MAVLMFSYFSQQTFRDLSPVHGLLLLGCLLLTKFKLAPDESPRHPRKLSIEHNCCQLLPIYDTCLVHS